MLAIVPDRGRWLRKHPLEVAIVVLTPPVLSASLQALRVVRLLRPLGYRLCRRQSHPGGSGSAPFAVRATARA
jgi:hypothetical protein